ncbi:MAG TPA: hypothetical protein VLA43_04230, partial [Longimicrobiales bacterium]|nr:hypothetical protein [Longimicrobiales bacterium]
NVIVKPKIYEKCRSAIRMEPFLSVEGELRKDGASLNVVAREVRAIRGDERSRAAPGTLAGALPAVLDYWGGDPRTGQRSGDSGSPGGTEGTAPPDASPSSTSHPADTGGGIAAPPDPFRYLTALRQNSPDARSWG